METGDPDAALPYWAFAWGGGLAIARYLRDHPQTVAGRRVFDLGTGSGLCAIAALGAGASDATAADIDAFAAAAAELNAPANGQAAVSNGMKQVVLRAYPQGDPQPFRSPRS